ncbi:MAG: serine hydrolase [Ruminococcaceae bacterium]|nr:serine hydrolase [Oscillospiraceae bacterium]
MNTTALPAEKYRSKVTEMAEFFTYTTPEKAGISSKAVLKFLKEFEHYGMFLHSIVLLKGHEIFTEMYRKPFKQNELHRMYSISKSFVSMAIGILIDEGKVNLDDKILKFFPEYDEATTDEYFRDMTIEDMLKMSTVFTQGTTYSARRPAYLEPNWVHTFFNVESSHPAGTVFNYDTSASYMLDVVVEKITGMPFLEFLKQRALLKTGFSESARCLKAPEGYSWGGSAVLASSLDLARFARLVMDGGKWNGEQLLPEWYIKKATTSQIDNGQEGFFSVTHGHGYGYQIWRTQDDTISFLGMGHQLAVMMPDEDLLFVCTADLQGYSGASTVVFMNLINNIKNVVSDSSLSDDTNAFAELKEYCENREYPTYPGKTTSSVGEYIKGKTYVLGDNPMGITDICITWDNDGNAVMKYTNAQGAKELKFGIGKTVIDEFPQDGYFGDTIGVDGGRRYRCIASGAWTMENTLHIKADLIDDYFGNVSIVLSYKGDEIGVYMQPHAEWFLNEYNGFAGGRIKE